MVDPLTARHERRVAHLARSISRVMGFGEEDVEQMRIAALLHDIGKISIPTDLLLKPVPMSQREFELMKTHPRVGHDLLRNTGFQGDLPEVVFQHHERMDGSGYPRGLRGDEILLSARVLAVADVVEAMSSHRPYRRALGIEVALQEVRQNEGQLYDVEVVDACLRLFARGFTLLG